MLLRDHVWSATGELLAIGFAVAALLVLIVFRGQGSGVSPVVAPPSRFTLNVRLRAIVFAESHSIDGIDSDGGHQTLAGTTARVDIPGRSAIRIEGWAVDRAAKRPCRGVYAVVGGTAYTSTTGISREDVATALGNRVYAKSGFSLDIPGGILPLGDSALVVRAISADGLRSEPIGPPVLVTMRP